MSGTLGVLVVFQSSQTGFRLSGSLIKQGSYKSNTLGAQCQLNLHLPLYLFFTTSITLLPPSRLLCSCSIKCGEIAPLSVCMRTPKFVM